MMTVVPILRIAPTDGNMPLRTFHNRAHSPGSLENWIGRNVGIPVSADSITCICSDSAA